MSRSPRSSLRRFICCWKTASAAIRWGIAPPFQRDTARRLLESILYCLELNRRFPAPDVTRESPLKERWQAGVHQAKRIAARAKVTSATGAADTAAADQHDVLRYAGGTACVFFGLRRGFFRAGDTVFVRLSAVPTGTGLTPWRRVYIRLFAQTACGKHAPARILERITPRTLRTLLYRLCRPAGQSEPAGGGDGDALRAGGSAGTRTRAFASGAGRRWSRSRAG